MLILVLRFGSPLKLRKKEDLIARLDSSDKMRPVHSGARFSPTRLRSLITHANDISMTIWDPVEQCAIRLAMVKIGDNELRSGPDGKFVVSNLENGVHVVSVTKDGYVTERFEVRIPHRGHLHGIRVDLVQVRIRLLEIYRQEALPLLPKTKLWACWTPAELARHTRVESGRLQPSLEKLTELLEHCYWSGELAGEKVLQKAQKLRNIS